MWKSDFAEYLRYRAIEWIAWSSSLFLIQLAVSMVGRPDRPGTSRVVSALVDAAVFVSFANVYVYILFYYPVVSLLTFFAGKVLLRSRSAGRMFWMTINVCVPLLFGMMLMIAIYGPRPVWQHLIALVAAVSANAFAMASDSYDAGCSSSRQGAR